VIKFKRLGQAGYVIFLALLIAEPPRCGGPTPMLSAAQFPPTIEIAYGKTLQGLPYISGGVSSDEREVMQERGKTYNVKLVFADKSGALLADVKLIINDSAGQEIVFLRAAGPWVYVQLLPGIYHLQASAVARTQELKALRVMKDQKTQHVFVWDFSS
jgi:hypothetical protein